MKPLHAWQQALWDKLMLQWQQQRFPHALLLLGPQGAAKQQFAKRLAQKILCKQNQAAPCGQCRSCHLLQTGAHPDYYLLTNEEKAKPIKVDQVRTLSANLNKTAQLNGYQVALIAPAQNLNHASANALLKTLEEPPGSVVIFLVAETLQTLPATLLSRCQRLHFNPPATEHALPMDRESYFALRNLLVKSLWQLLQFDVVATTVATDLVKQDPIVMLELIFTVMLDILRISQGLPNEFLTFPDCRKPLQALSAAVDPLRFTAWIPELLRTKARLQLSSGLNVQLLFESLLIHWQKLKVQVC